MSRRQGDEELLKLREALLRQVRQAYLTMGPLESDLTEASRRWNAENRSQFWARVVVRCLCAAIEARLFVFRRMAEKLAVVSGVQFDQKELEILTERRVIPGPNGPTVRPKWLPFPDAVKESLRLFAKATQTSVTVDYSASGFRSLCGLFEIRNRLMHPKEPFDIEINPKNIATANAGVDWFDKIHVDLVNKCQAQVEARVKQGFEALQRNAAR